MLRRITLVLLLVCLPFRLWAAEGLMSRAVGEAPGTLMQMDEQTAMQHDASEPPCHEEAMHTQSDASLHAVAAPCNASDCRICSACHMPALHVFPLLSFTLDAPRDWSVQIRLVSYSAPQPALFKPPVS